MKPEAFSELCRKAAFYVWPNTVGTPVVRGGITKKGDPWILTVEDDGFHVLPTRNLTEVIGAGQVTWKEADGHPAFVIADLSQCEELNPVEANGLIDQAREYYAGASASAWLKQQIADADAVPDIAMQYTRDADPAPPPEEPPVEK